MTTAIESIHRGVAGKNGEGTLADAILDRICMTHTVF